MTKTTRTLRELVLLTLLAAAIFSPAIGLAQEPARGFPDLAAALARTPGCLGVESAKTASGKQVLFAWFENKQAVLNWYHSDVHRMLMQTLTPNAGSGREPLAHIADNSGPILAVASLTFAENAGIAGVRLPVSQIAIELYAPLPGGFAAGGRFAPSGVQVPELMEAPARPK